jgi:hypothetical protein
MQAKVALLVFVGRLENLFGHIVEIFYLQLVDERSGSHGIGEVRARRHIAPHATNVGEPTRQPRFWTFRALATVAWNAVRFPTKPR